MGEYKLYIGINDTKRRKSREEKGSSREEGFLFYSLWFMHIYMKEDKWVPNGCYNSLLLFGLKMGGELEINGPKVHFKIPFN